MKISNKSLVFTLLVLLFGFTVAFIIKGFWVDEFKWNQWLSWMIGGIIGHLIIVLFAYSNRKKDSK